MSPSGGLTQNNLHLQQNHNATGQGGTCFGDSGGPHFWKDTDRDGLPHHPASNESHS